MARMAYNFCLRGETDVRHAQKRGFHAKARQIDRVATRGVRHAGRGAVIGAGNKKRPRSGKQLA
jgi:hypothetical protein